MEDRPVLVLAALLKIVHRTEERHVEASDHLSGLLRVEEDLSGGVGACGIAFVPPLAEPVLAVVKQQNTLVGQQRRRTALGQGAVEMTLARIDHSLQIPVCIQLGGPVDQVVRCSDVDHPFAPVHHILPVHARDDQPVAVELRHNRPRLALQVAETSVVSLGECPVRASSKSPGRATWPR